MLRGEGAGQEGGKTPATCVYFLFFLPETMFLCYRSLIFGKLEYKRDEEGAQGAH